MIPGNFYMSDNYYDVSAVKKGGRDGKTPDYAKIAQKEKMYKEASVDKPFAIKTDIAVQPSADAYKDVLKSVGASKKRDAVDKRIIKEVKAGNALYKGSVTGLPGIIDSENDLK
jgi:hypothetical protein